MMTAPAPMEQAADNLIWWWPLTGQPIMRATPSPPTTVDGSCLCGSVAYRIEPAACHMVHCHCSMCRKHQGGSFATFIAVPHIRFRWLGGQRQIARFASSDQGHRDFCITCGSPVPVILDELDLVIVPAGTLSDDPGVRPEAHWFVASKAPWVELGDTLTRHEEYPPEYGVVHACQMPPRDVGAANGGSCLCGATAFELYGTPIRAVHCHCSRCRRSRGAACATNAIYALDNLRFTRQDAALVDYKVPDARYFCTTFCSRCGGRMPRSSPERNLAIVPMGVLDGMPGFKPQAHIHAASKAPWYDIDDDLPQHAGPPPA